MSRIVKSIIESAWTTTDELNIVLFLDKNKIDKEVLNLNAKLMALEAHPLDINNRIITINPQEISFCLSFMPNLVICDTLGLYGHASNFANSFKIPLLNLFRKEEPVKREGVFSIAREALIDNINLVSSNELANKLFITNYSLFEENLEAQIRKHIKTWIPK